MEGLEVSEITLSNLEFSRRLDSEYYKKYLLEYEKSIRKNSRFIELSKDAKFLIGPFGSAFDTSNYIENGVHRYVRGQDVKPFLLKDSEIRYLPEADFKRLEKYSLRENDILVSVVGTLGNACIVENKDLPAIFSCKSSVIRPAELNPYYVLTYLNSKIGKELLLRKERGAIQKGLNLEDLKTILIPLVDFTLQNQVEKTLKEAYLKLEISKNRYNQAETLLLESIGLKDFEPSQEPVNVKSFKESFGASGRLDAEYYQVKYDDYINLIKGYNNSFATISTICNLKDTNFNPSEDTEYQYIELSNIGKSGDITGCTVAIGSELPSRARRIVNTNDVIISSIEGSLQSCALVQNDYNNALCSTGFYVINSDKINSETLLVLFKSEPMQNILKQNCSGTILTAINKTEFLNIPVPIIENTIQQKIAELVEESFSLKAQSEKLLEVAKRAVEMAIEENEDVAMEFIKQSS